MREIMFRGKRIDNGEWVEGFYNHLPCGRFGADEHMIQTVLENGKIGMLHDIDPSTVGQFTGLKDKNGKLIFEGDIIAVPYEEDREPVEGTFIYYENGKLYFDETNFGWYVKFLGDQLSLWEFDDCGVTIIGNIHDNPELLDGGADDEV